MFGYGLANRNVGKPTVLGLPNVQISQNCLPLSVPGDIPNVFFFVCLYKRDAVIVAL